MSNERNRGLYEELAAERRRQEIAGTWRTYRLWDDFLYVLATAVFAFGVAAAVGVVLWVLLRILFFF